MITINLMPQAAIEARRARSRACTLLAVFATIGTTWIALTGAASLVQFIGDGDAQQVSTLTAEIQSMQRSLEQYRRDVKEEELHAQERSSLRLAMFWVHQQVMKIVTSIPQRVTLSSLRVRERQIILAGVAGTRADVGHLVSALRGAGYNHDISVESLRDITIERQTFQEFVIRVTGESSRERDELDARTKNRAERRASH
jgi:hypothetical protein